MGKRMKKKGTVGNTATYITRNRACKKLHISLKDFRKLCILKGIYPQDPSNRKGFKPQDTLYYYKDVQFIAHDPMIDFYRRCKIAMRRRRKYKDKRNAGAVQRWKNNMPTYKLDHIVKERYPTFVDALRDLDDCVSMAFLYATFPKSRHNHETLTLMCRRLTIEFLQYVIESRSLEKTFISIKGYYYQAQIMGQTISWVVPHYFGFNYPDQVDFRIMRTFTEFYLTLMGFVNFRLYHSLNAVYPPQLNLTSSTPEDSDYALGEQQISEAVSALNQRILRNISTSQEEEPELDDFPLGDDNEQLKEAKATEEKNKKFKKLFEGLKFYINREIPREAFVFVIRSFGGETSWDKSVYIGATFDRSDETITHELVDRPNTETTFINRYYIQPQWVFDCVNARMLLPVEDYFPGAVLPPHLSPFVEEKEGDYIPPERQAQINRQLGLDPSLAKVDVSSDDEDQFEMEEVDESSPSEEEIPEIGSAFGRKENSDPESSSAEDSTDSDEYKSDNEIDNGSEDAQSGDEQSSDHKKIKLKDEKKAPGKQSAKNADGSLTQAQKRKKEYKKKNKKQKMEVLTGKINHGDSQWKIKQQETEEQRLAELMIPKRKKYLYNLLRKKELNKKKEIERMKSRRIAYEKQQKLQKKKKLAATES